MMPDLFFGAEYMKPHQYTYTTEVHVITNKKTAIKKLHEIKHIAQANIHSSLKTPPLKVNLKPKKKVVNIYFDFDSFVLKPGELLKIKNLKIKNASLIGMASPEGTSEYNKRLSLKRALSVKKALEKNGTKVVSIKALGEEGCREKDEKNYPKCRKVEIRER